MQDRAAEKGEAGAGAAVRPVDSAGSGTATIAGDAPYATTATASSDEKPARTAQPAAVGYNGMTKSDRRKWTLVLISVLVSSTMILTRGVFRSIELSNGWSGHLVETEIYQMVLDGIPMTIAVGIFNFLHPGLILGRKDSWRGYY
jgi:hypothetical protein